MRSRNSCTRINQHATSVNNHSVFKMWLERAYTLRSAVRNLLNFLRDQSWEIIHELNNAITMEEYEEESWIPLIRKYDEGILLCQKYLNERILCKRCLVFNLEELELPTDNIEEYIEEVDNEATITCDFCDLRPEDLNHPLLLHNCKKVVVWKNKRS